jgi:predicted NUDIX family phosphoesterase
MSAHSASAQPTVECVYVVPRADLFPRRYPRGFVPFGADLDARAVLECIATKGFFVERSVAETQPLWKQVIPYTAVTCGERVLLLERTKKGGEARLANKLSIGVGGHLDLVDLVGGERARIVERGTLRELSEELFVPGLSVAPQPFAIINDDDTEVGAVHVGLVQTLALSEEVRVREADLLVGRYASRAELKQLVAANANFETWSRFFVETIDTWLPHGAGR